MVLRSQNRVHSAWVVTLVSSGLVSDVLPLQMRAAAQSFGSALRWGGRLDQSVESIADGGLLCSSVPKHWVARDDCGTRGVLVPALTDRF